MSAQLITAVALYGRKTGSLKSLLEAVHAISREKMRDGFRPYALDQIHGTLIRLDGIADRRSGLIVNQHYREFAGAAFPMDHARALKILAGSLTPPVAIRIGGFERSAPATFSSRGQHPYERMFSVQGPAFVLMGWPVTTVINGISQRPLDGLRRSMNDANILHWYHESWTDIDNDFHLVIGHRHRVGDHAAIEAVHAVRAYLARHPVQIEVGTDDVAIIAANSPTLAPAQFIGRLPLNAAEIGKLYR